MTTTPKPERASRRAAVKGFKRQSILDAARRLFATDGMERTSLRAIAKAAGYTPGALYAFWPGKRELFAEAYGATLHDLGHAVRQAMAVTTAPNERAKAGLRAVHAFFHGRPDDFDLGLAVYRGGGPALSELDRQLNGRLIAALRPIAEALTEGGRKPAEAQATTVAAYALIT
ncbi:MAG: TetR/AcrR family transcriptional regulator, partial [Alphaproteobacteria bacterium]|nr:TetR/AcrR family transcriptional regulator [Alphaproteobacteria bacterium]